MKFDDLKIIFEDKIPGGKADNKSINDIAKKHNVDIEYIKEQFKIGIDVEGEHTEDKDIAAEIALDHLDEIPDYYTRLLNMEKKAKAN